MTSKQCLLMIKPVSFWHGHMFVGELQLEDDMHNLRGASRVSRACIIRTVAFGSILAKWYSVFYIQRCNESSFPRVRVESESACLESESESRCVGLEYESESSRFRVQVRVQAFVYIDSRVRIRVPIEPKLSLLQLARAKKVTKRFNIFWNITYNGFE